MTPTEIIALILIIASAIKIIVLLVSPKSWLTFSKGIYSKPGAVKVIGFVLAAVVLYYLLQGGLTIVQILAVTAFVALLFAIGLASEVKPLIKKFEAQLKRGSMWKEYWFYTLLWIILLVWAAKELFM